MQNAALRVMGINGAYVAFDVAPEHLGIAIRGLAVLGAAGANCTIPHKQAVIEHLDELDEEASFIGAVNTIVFDRVGSGSVRLRGHNTDAYGFLTALQAHGVEIAGRRALVLGAGGSARAVVAALARTGAMVSLAGRTRRRAELLAEEFNQKLGAERIRAIADSGEELAEHTRGADLIVNTTPVGMSPQVDTLPPCPVESLRPGQFVYDLIYNPLETRLLQAARGAGAEGAHGAGMLAHQGARALELWTGRPAPADLMEREILASY